MTLCNKGALVTRPKSCLLRATWQFYTHLYSTVGYHLRQTRAWSVTLAILPGQMAARPAMENCLEKTT